MSKDAFDFDDGTPFGEAFVEVLKDGFNHELVARGPITSSRGVVAVLHPQLAHWDSGAEAEGLGEVWEDIIRCYFANRAAAERLWVTKTEAGWVVFSVQPPEPDVSRSGALLPTTRSRWFGYYDRAGCFHLEGAS